ncbi:MAG: hypothetical protein KIT72_04000 [Polyangiaceae bacterium]|nr:hypothetical protein [Polyangiaceae bacterium]MCW5789566.1 hypothetical protein [Polyangiaceae bacterium]
MPRLTQLLWPAALSSRAVVLPGALLLFVAACGGAAGSTSGEAPRSGGAGGDRTAPDGAEVEGEAAAGRCDDGSCVECGEGLCLAGSYCELTSDGSAGCSWSEACVERPTCDCLRPTLDPGCTCETQGGGATVRCR